MKYFSFLVLSWIFGVAINTTKARYLLINLDHQTKNDEQSGIIKIIFYMKLSLY